MKWLMLWTKKRRKFFSVAALKDGAILNPSDGASHFAEFWTQKFAGKNADLGLAEKYLKPHDSKSKSK